MALPLGLARRDIRQQRGATRLRVSSTEVPAKRVRRQTAKDLRLARRLTGGTAFGIHVSRPSDTNVSERIPMYRNVFRT